MKKNSIRIYLYADHIVIDEKMKKYKDLYEEEKQQHEEALQRYQ